MSIRAHWQQLAIRLTCCPAALGSVAAASPSGPLRALTAVAGVLGQVRPVDTQYHVGVQQYPVTTCGTFTSSCASA